MEPFKGRAGGVALLLIIVIIVIGVALMTMIVVGKIVDSLTT